MRSAIWAAALFTIVFTIDALCPVSTMFDSRWTIPVALSQQHGTLCVDRVGQLRLRREHLLDDPVGFLDILGDEKVSLHERFDGTARIGIAETESRRKLGLYVERQPLFRASDEIMQPHAHIP